MKHPFRVLLAIAAAALPGSLPIAAAGSGRQPEASAGISNTDRDYVEIRNGEFVRRGRPFILRGTNYFGSWRFPNTIRQGNGIEQATIWSFWQNWDPHKLDLDFRFLKAQLNATALRIGTPARSDFAALVRYHGYAPWYEPDGSITAIYGKRLVELADLADADHLRIQLCLLWNIKNEIAAHPGDFAPGRPMDRFYANQVRSIATALRDHPGVMAYSVGNEVLVDWPINGTHRSWYEGVAAAFIARRLDELRAAAPTQLLTDDEVAHPDTKWWSDPGPDFAELGAPEAGRAGQPFRLADRLDYLGVHFYPEKLTPADLRDDRFEPKLVDSQNQLTDYVKAASKFHKPIVINEFGLKLDPPTIGREYYSRPRDALFRVVVSAAERDGIQGLLAWIALPGLTLRPGSYIVMPSALNRYSPIEVDVRSPAQRILFYDPSCSLFDWEAHGPLPLPSAAAASLASAWLRTLSPPGPLTR